MAYTDSEEVQADFKDMDFAISETVTSDDVDQFIVEVDALINSYVGKRYTVPVVSGDGLNLLKLCSRSLVAARIKAVMQTVQVIITEGNQNVVSSFLSPTAVMKILNDIKNGELTLGGAESLVSGGGFFSKNVACDIESVVKKDDKQW